MTTLFKIESSDIKSLNDLQLTKLLKLLLFQEARRSGIAERSVDVALNINVPDGGEDGRISWNGDPQCTDFLPLSLVQFQNKATTNMGPADCAKEIIKKDGTIKHKVDEVLNAGGAYILFTTQELNHNQKTKRVTAIREKLEGLGKEYAPTAFIDVYDASKISGWVNNYITAIVAVLNWIGRPLERGLKTWENWSQHPEYQRFAFATDVSREEAINSLRNLLNNKRSCARIIGLSGIGKTRLAYEAFKDVDELDDLSKRVIYLDASANLAVHGLICDWVQSGLEGIVVVDNCDISLQEPLIREVKRSDSKLSMLTLDYNLDRSSQTEIIHLKKLPDDQIKQMIEPVYGKVIRDIDRIVAFAQGFPQMAVLLADARLDKEPEMGRLTDDQLASKMLWGGRDPTVDDEKILRGCSLFDRFGIDEDVSIEFQFIAQSIVNIDVDTFYDCVKRYEERGLIDRRGRFVSLVPKPLAIRLAAEWWRRTRPERQLELIQAEMPGNLIENFCNQISRLDFLPEVKFLSEQLCGPQGPFGQAEVILSKRGSRLFRAFAEVSPDVTSKTLLNILKGFDEKRLFQIKGDVRRNLVYALEKLCFHKSCFEESVKSLLLLASCENETWGNNATGIFKQLFQVFLSGTEAPPPIRINIIDEMLRSNQTAIKELAVEALDQAITTYTGSRIIGAEYQGSGEPLVEWRPKVWGEVFQYWDQALSRLCNIVIEDDLIAKAAKDSIARNMRGIIGYGRVEILDQIIKKIVEKKGQLWPEALDSIKDSLRYDSKKIPEKGKTKLNEWIALLTPTELGERLILFVTNPPHEHVKKDDGHYEDIAARNAKVLAEELAPNIDSVLPFVDNLLIGQQRLANWFGKNLVEISGEWEPLLSVVLEKIISKEGLNISFLLGILNGIYNIDSSSWEDIVKSFYTKEHLNQHYAQALTSGQVSLEQLDCLISLIENNNINPDEAIVFTFGRPLDHLNCVDIAGFICKLAFQTEEAAWIALDILSMYCLNDQARWDSCKFTFKEIVITLELDKAGRKQSQLETYHWFDIVKKLLKDEDPKFATDIARQILSSYNSEIDLTDLWHYIQPIVRIIFKKYSKDVWPLFSDAILNAGPINEYKLIQLLGTGNQFDARKPSVLSDLSDEVLKNWCLDNPQKAPEFVAQATDVLLDDGEVYKISPRAMFLIDKFGENERILTSLSANISSFGWSGSLVPYLQKEIAALEILKDHKYWNVREWVSNRIGYLSKMIERETRRDEELDWGIY